MHRRPILNTAQVSVVVPCFNSSETIRRALDSVASQTRQPFEVIVVDDGSADGSANIVEEWGKDNSAIALTLLKQENGGAAAARNAGIAAATGEFVALLDSDDAWLPEKLSKQLAFMETNVTVGLCSHAILMAGSSALGSSCIRKKARQMYKEISFFQLLLKNPIYTPTVVFRREVGLRFDERLQRCDDHLAWMLTAARGTRIIVLGEPLCMIFKPLIGGASGLSSSFVKMEIAELNAYLLLYKGKEISVVSLLLVWFWSLAKFCRRLLVRVVRDSI